MCSGQLPAEGVLNHPFIPCLHAGRQLASVVMRPRDFSIYPLHFEAYSSPSITPLNGFQLQQQQAPPPGAAAATFCFAPISLAAAFTFSTSSLLRLKSLFFSIPSSVRTM